MKEYGTNIQKLADVIMTVGDRGQRTKQAHVLIELMRQIHPQMREGQDYSKKLWDDLYIITNFELDVDSPYPPPPKEILGKKPMKVPYNQVDVSFRFYGRNIELLIAKACATNGEDERKAFVSYLFKQMKTFYIAWNKETVANDDIFDHIIRLSGGKLRDEVQFLRTNGLVESAPKDGQSRSYQRQNMSGGERSRPNNNAGSRNNSGGGHNSGNRNNGGSNNNNRRGDSQGGNNNNNRRRRY